MARPTVSTTFNAKDKVSPTLQKMQKRVTGFSKNTQRSFSGIGSKIMRMRSLLVGAGAALVGGKIAQGISQFADAGDEIAKTARQVGIGVEALQELRFAADRQGVSTENLEKSMKALNNRLGLLRNGQGQLNTLLEGTNPQLREQLQNTESTEEAFMLLMNAMNEAGSAAERTALAQAAFSSSGRELVRISEAGADGIAALRQEARDLGVVMDEEATAKAEAFKDAQANLSAAMTGLRNRALTPLIAKLTPLIQGIADYVANNKELIQQKIEDAFKRIENAVKTVVRLWNSGLIPAVLLTIGIFKGASMAVAAFQTALAVAKGAQIAFNAAMAANPIGLIVTAITVVLIPAIMLLIKHWDQVKEWIVSTTQTIGDAIKAGFKAALDFVKRIFFTFADYILSTLGNIIKAVLNVGSKVGSLLGFDTSGIDKLTKKLSGLQQQVRSQSAIGDLIGDAGTGTTLIGRNDGQIQRSESVSRSEVDINIAGMPQGSTTRQRGRAPGVRLNLGEAGGL